MSLYSRKLRILHAPSDIGNQPWGVSQAERQLGHTSRVLVYQQHYNFGSDFDLHFERRNKLGRLLVAMWFFVRAIWQYDIFHFYFATSFFPGFVDLPILKLFGKKIFFTFQGCDIRATEGCAPAMLNPAQHTHAPVAVQQKRLRTILKYVTKTYVLNPDLLRYSPTSEFLPYASVDVDTWPVHYPTYQPGQEVVIFHAPSDRLVKGSDHVERAVKELQASGYKIKLDLVTGVPHQTVLEHIQRAHIVIDQLLVGWYGGFAVETTAMGKPTICFIQPEWLSWTPMNHELPLINATPKTITQVLKDLLDHPERWDQLGRLSRAWAEKFHDPNKIAERLTRDYQGASA